MFGFLTLPRRWSGFWEPPLVVTLVFMTFVVARYMQWGARRDILATVRFEFLLGIVLIAACASLLSATPIKLERLPDARRVVIMISLLFVVMVTQIPFAVAPDTAWSVFLDRVVKFGMLTLFMAVLVRSPKSMRFFVFAFLLACFYVTMEAARGAFSGGLIWENQGVMRLHGAVPIYRHPNSLAGIAMGVVPFVAFLFPALRSRIWKLILLLPLMTSLICLLYSGSRTGYVAFFAFLLFWWSQSRRKIRWIVVMVGLCAALYPVIPEQYVERFRSIGGQEAEGNSKEKRIEILEDAVTIFAENPFGVGVASFPAAREARFGRKQDTHNLYLEVATNLGVQGLVVFLLLLTSVLQLLRNVAKALDRDVAALKRYARKKSLPGGRRRAAAAWSRELRFLHALAQATAGFITVRLALGLFGMDLYEVYWWFAAGLAISLDQIRLRARATTLRLMQGA